MNKLEKAYSERLELLRLAGEIDRWDYQPCKWRLADKTYYTPDFLIIRNDGIVEFHETKGFMRDDAAVKIKAVAERYPYFVFVLVKQIKREWTFDVIAPHSGCESFTGGK